MTISKFIGTIDALDPYCSKYCFDESYRFKLNKYCNIMRKFCVVTWVCLGAFVFPVSSFALLIDNFSDGVVHLIADSTSTTASLNQTGLNTSDVMDGHRYTWIRHVSGLGKEYADTQPDPPSQNYMSFSSGSTDIPLFMLRYSNDGAGLNQDFTVGGAQGIYIQFLSNDVGSDVRLRVQDGSGTYFNTIQNITGIGQLFFPYTLIPAADWTDIESVEFLFNVGQFVSPDYTIDLIETRDRPPGDGVPDSAGTLALLTIALGLLGAARLKMA